VFLPLTAAQLLWINIVTDGPPALALALDRNPGVMRRPPRPGSARLLDGPSLRFIMMAATAQALIGASLLVGLPRLGYALPETRTALFLYEALVELAIVYPARKIVNVPLANPALHLAVAFGVALQGASILIPGLRSLLGLVPIDWLAAGLAVMAVGCGWAAAEFAARVSPGRRTPIVASQRT
jgi:Ca2+-transporting ATPase